MFLTLGRFWDRLPLVGRLLVTASLALLTAAMLMLYSAVQGEVGEARAQLMQTLGRILRGLAAHEAPSGASVTVRDGRIALAHAFASFPAAALLARPAVA